MDDLTLFLTIVMAGLAGLLFLVSFVSWYRIRHAKLLLVSVAIFLFFIKAVLLILEIVIQDEKAIVIDSIILVLLYFSILKKL